MSGKQSLLRSFGRSVSRSGCDAPMNPVQVYEHHCIEQLPGPTRRLRDGAVHLVNNMEAVQWALELYGFKGVNIKVRQCS